MPRRQTAYLIWATPLVRPLAQKGREPRAQPSLKTRCTAGQSPRRTPVGIAVYKYQHYPRAITAGRQHTKSNSAQRVSAMRNSDRVVLRELSSRPRRTPVGIAVYKYQHYPRAITAGRQHTKSNSAQGKARFTSSGVSPTVRRRTLRFIMQSLQLPDFEVAGAGGRSHHDFITFLFPHQAPPDGRSG